MKAMVLDEDMFDLQKHRNMILPVPRHNKAECFAAGPAVIAKSFFYET